MEKHFSKKIDWLLIGIYLFLISFGWMNIYASASADDTSVLDFSTKYGMHLIWIASALILAILILFVIPSRSYMVLSWWLYILVLLALIAVVFVGVEVNGSKSWFAIGPFRLQPAEFSKISMSLLLATIMSSYDYKFTNPKDMAKTIGVLLLPMMVILLEKETGSALVYLGFILVLYREGMTGWILVMGLVAILLFIMTLLINPFVAILILMGIIFVLAAVKSQRTIFVLILGAITVTLSAFLPRIGKIESISELYARFTPQIWLTLITVPVALFYTLKGQIHHNRIMRNSVLCYMAGLAMVFSVQFFFDNVLKDHQRLRIESLLGLKDDPMGVGYNVHQSMIAIGSGGFHGKGFLNGTQTRFDFVPEQSTDFIFCTVGEEWGFIGALIVIIAYVTLILRIFNTAEKQNEDFTRIYGYCLASCLLMHVFINISMTIGLMPVIGIPLPFMSYGGSSLWAFTILLFIYIRLSMDSR